jgi:thiosulfate dehydrogenase (quinone) large subunit
VTTGTARPPTTGGSSPSGWVGAALIAARDSGLLALPSRWVVVPLRLYLSTAFLDALTNKFGPGKWTGWLNWMPGYLADQIPRAAAWYRPALAAVVLPHARLFAGLVSIGEVSVGFALLFGAGTRLAAAVGMFLTANYFLFNGLSVLDESNDFAIMVGCFVVLLTAAGRTFGVDAFLARRWPDCPLW